MVVERFTEKQFEQYKEAFNATENPAVYLAIDPGKSNGVCVYDERYYLLAMLTIVSEDMITFLENLEHIKICIIEDFVLYPTKAEKQHYSDMETSRVIGRVEGWAARKNIELVKQLATIKNTGYLWIGQKPPKKSDPRNHVMDANVHFVYWAVKSGRMDARRLL